MGKLTALILAGTALPLIVSPVTAEVRCIMSYCQKNGGTATPSRNYITNTSRQIIGDIYDPGHGRRVQIRDTSRRIIGYIERDGTVTNTSRQPVADIELD